MPRVTIREIADLAGVSIATVSRVMNGHSDVAEETRDLVMRIVREHGYATNRSARGLSAGRTGLVGVLVPLVYPVYCTSRSSASFSPPRSTSTTVRSRCSTGSCME